MDPHLSFEKEIWRPVPDYRFSDFYDISSLGRVRSHDRKVIELNGKERFHAGRILTNKKAGKYLAVSLSADSKSSRFYVHRLVALAFLANPGNKLFVNHINFDTHDNQVANLEWVTAKENSNHAGLAGRLGPKSPRCGAESHCSKFTEEDVKFLRNTWRPGQSIRLLADQYKVTHRAAYKMLQGLTWRHVDPPVAINWPRSARN
jgi:hypothetical protein